MRPYIKLHEKDNVIIALNDLPKGEQLHVEGNVITLAQDVVRGHKIAIAPITEQQNITKYGFPIGHASEAIAIGQHVHTHNTKTNLSECLAYEYEPDLQDKLAPLLDREIKAYQRPSGEIGIRNELWVIPTVGCINKIAQQIKTQFLAEKNTDSIDGVFVFEHAYGCSQMGDDHETTKKILQNIVRHPNAGGVLVVGLGCENNQVAEFKATLGDYDENRIRFMIAQEQDDEVEMGVEILHELFGQMATDQRTPATLKDLRIGLKCGGSDGFSGITGNPLLGYLSDYIVRSGGTTVLTEVPEMFGAETILMARAESEEVFQKTVNLINDFKNYYERNNQVCYENPSPGNKNGGITTLEDKSLGCTQKAGTSNVVDVLQYTERVQKPGLNLLQGPGNDLIAATALGAAGCHLVLFTTGRGTPYGGFVPTIKVATNTQLAEKKKHWIDYDAGQMLTSTTEEVVEDFINYVVDVCSGQWTNNEKNGFREIAIWKTGVTL